MCGLHELFYDKFPLVPGQVIIFEFTFEYFSNFPDALMKVLLALLVVAECGLVPLLYDIERIRNKEGYSGACIELERDYG